MLIEAVADPAGGNDPALAEKIAKAHQAAVASPPTPSSLQAAVGSPGNITTPAHQQQQLDPQETHYLGHLVSKGDASTEDGSHASSSGLATDKGYHPTSEMGSITEELQFPYLEKTALSREEKDILKGRLQEESMQIMLKFQGLVDTFRESLEHRNVPVERLASLLSSLGAFTAVKSQRTLLEDCLPQIRDAPSIDHALWNLRHYFSFFNYHVIEHIIKGLGTRDDKSNLQKYKEDLKQYSKRRCYECPSCLVQPSDVGTKLILKLDVSFEPYSVEQLQIFRCRLSQILQISEVALKLCYIEEGCIQFTFQIPSFMEKEIFPLSHEQETVLIDEGVLDLRCGEYEFSAEAWKSANTCTPPSMSQSSRRAAEAFPSLGELLRNFPQQKLNQHCHEEDIAELSLSIIDWVAIAPFLGLTEAEEQAIKEDSASAETRRIAMLRKWKGKLGKKATYKKLAKLLYKTGKIVLVEKLCEILQAHADSNSESSDEFFDAEENTIQVSPSPHIETITHTRCSVSPPAKKRASHGRKCNIPEREPIRPPAISEREPIRSPTISEREPTRSNAIPEREPIRSPAIPEREPVRSPTIPEREPVRSPTIPEHEPIRSPTIPEHEPIRSPAIPEREPIKPPAVLESVKPPVVPECKQRNPLLASYANYLQGVYKTDNPGFLILQWPPPPTRKVFNLAMILQENMRCGPIDEEFVRLTLRGNVDDIMHRKTAVKVEDIFKLDTLKRKRRSDRKLVLIEGAPGAGKSTLAWHIPQKWARGELFQEFEVLVFIQMRDPEVQAAQSLADLLPAESRAEAENIASELCALRGQNVLFVLDSWDEFLPQLEVGSIFQQLICKPKMLNLHFSTVLITSRPIASGVLYPYVSSRVEIVGFTPTERKHYFTEVLRGDSEKVEKLQEHLSIRPMIEASCYLPLNAAIVAHLFLALNQTLPTTLQEVFTSLVICCLIRHMQREGREEELDIPDTPSFENLPVDIQQPFKNICTLAYHGVMKNKVTFSASDLQSFNLPTELSTLSLIQGVESFKSFKKAKSYNFLHLSIQELLAAFYIAKLSESEQIRIFKELFGEPRFAAVFQYYAAFSKLQAEGVRDVMSNIVRSDRKPLLLSLLHCLYEAQDLSLCHFVASQLNGKLNLKDNSLSPVDCLAVGYFLRSVCLATSGEFKANLEDCSLDDYRVSFLVRELSKCSSSNDGQSLAATDGGAPGCLDLNLESNKEIEGRGAKCIAELLSRCSLIGKLALNSCKKLQEGEDGLYHVLQALKVNTSLRYLSLRSCSLNITEDNGPVLTEMLQTNKTLKTLMLSANNISDMGVFHVAEGLSHNTGLQELSVQACDVTGKGAVFLSKALIVNKSLVTLNISYNDLGDEGIAHINHSLTINTTLRELDLRQCKLTEKGAELLAQLLTVNKDLEALYLWENAISDTGAIHFANALKHNHSLKKLSVSDCGIGDPGVTSLATTLTVNSTLEELNLGLNQFTDTGLVALGDSLKNNRGLQRLQLWNVKQVTAVGLCQFVLCLQENCHLTELEVSLTASGAETVRHETELVNETRRQRGLPELVTGW